MKLSVFLLALFNPFLLTGQTDSLTGVRKQLDSCMLSARNLTNQNLYERALQIISLADSLSRVHFGPQSLEYGNVCHSRGRVYDFKGEFIQAEEWYDKARILRLKLLGKEHPDYAWSLNNLAYVYQETGNFAKAEAYNQEAMKIREKILGKSHPDYSASANNLAILYWKQGKYQQAEQLYLEAKSIREKTLGTTHPEYIKSLINLGGLYSTMSRYEDAEFYQLQALHIQEQLQNESGSDYALTLNNLSVLYKRMGYLEKSLHYALKASDIYLNTLGNQHPDYARSLSTLANLFLEMGRYEDAEHHYSEALHILEKKFGKDHPVIASNLSNFGIFYSDLANYEKAEQFYVRAKSIREQKLGTDHPKYAESLNNLGILYWKMKQHAKAETLFLETESIRKKILGEKHEDYAGILNNLGGLYADMLQYEKAEEYLSLSYNLKEKHLGKEHPLFANSLQNLGELYFKMGNFQKAESFALQAKSLRERIYEKQNTSYLESLLLLANVYAYQNRFCESFPLLEEYFKFTKLLKAGSLSYLSEKELNFYVHSFQTDILNLSAYLFRQYTNEDSCTAFKSLVLNQMLFQKGFLLTAAQRINLLAGKSPESIELLSQLKAHRRILSTEYSKPKSARQFVELYEEKANALEKKLAQIISEYENVSYELDWRFVQKSLKSGEVAIEFIRFPVLFPKQTDSVLYAALLMKPGLKEPVFIPLFEEKSLDSLLNSHAARRMEYVNTLYSLAQRGATRLLSSTRSLAELIYQPLESNLKDIHTLYYSPTGLLHRLNLDAIPLHNQGTLADKIDLVELLSTRQLITTNNTQNTNATAVLYGGIHFDADSTADLSPLENKKWPDSSGTIQQKHLASRNIQWNFIPGTKNEIDSIAKILSKANFINSLYTGFEADERSFKMLENKHGSPRIIHLATHGYFFENPLEKVGNLPVGQAGSPSAVGHQKIEYQYSDQSMMRSGLIMAGANPAWQGNQPPEGKEDGILTAYEISQMNLPNTELVVLSACETGLGDIQGNEGVYGVQRAFKIAGVKYIIMSLWQVPDKQTSMLMITFYKKWLEHNMTIPDAFRTAQKELRDIGLDPYQWAGFVLLE